MGTRCWYSNDRYWLKEKTFKLVTINWGRDDDNPFYFSWIPRGVDITLWGRRILIEEFLVWHT